MLAEQMGPEATDIFSSCLYTPVRCMRGLGGNRPDDLTQSVAGFDQNHRLGGQMLGS